MAASLNATQSWPSAVICISGGYFPSSTYVFHASPFNIIIPGLSNIVKSTSMPDLIRNHKTHWLFTLGKLDIGGFHVLAEENLLSQHYQGINQVTVRTHNGGHEVPTRILDDFLYKILLE